MTRRRQKVVTSVMTVDRTSVDYTFDIIGDTYVFVISGDNNMAPPFIVTLDVIFDEPICVSLTKPDSTNVIFRQEILNMSRHNDRSATANPSSLVWSVQYRYVIDAPGPVDVVFLRRNDVPRFIYTLGRQ